MPPSDYPRDDLFRMHVPVGELRFAGEDGNTLVGYAAMFNTATRIASWEGEFDETIAPGAFAKTINERGDSIKVLFDHGFDPSIGNKPIARLDSIVEDEVGLRVEATFVDRPYAIDIREAIRAGAITGMSFRFTVIKETWDNEPDTPSRTLHEVRLHELGPVTFPAYEATTAGVRGAAAYTRFIANDAPSSTDPEPEPATATPDPETDEPAFDATRANNRIPVTRGRITRFMKERS